MNRIQKSFLLNTIDEEELIGKLKEIPALYRTYLQFTPEWKERILDFFLGKKSLPMLYDVFFKRIFNPEIHRDRLSDFISQIIGETVIVREVLPNEDSFLEGERMVIMDIIVELLDGSIANVEIQKSPYLFPGQRIACYSSDLILRQYSKIRSSKGKNFSYGDLKRVYTIVVYEKTGQVFHKLESYIHKGKVVFDTGLDLELLQQDYLISLDVFREKAYHKEKTRLAGWLSFLTTDDISDVEMLLEEFPWLEEVYHEIALYRSNPEGVIDMYSQVLRQMDENTLKYIVDIQKAEIEGQKAEIEGQKAEIEGQKAEIEGQKAEIERLKELLKKNNIEE